MVNLNPVYKRMWVFQLMILLKSILKLFYEEQLLDNKAFRPKMLTHYIRRTIDIFAIWFFYLSQRILLKICFVSIIGTMLLNYNTFAILFYWLSRFLSLSVDIAKKSCEMVRPVTEIERIFNFFLKYIKYIISIIVWNYKDNFGCFILCQTSKKW